MSKALGRNPSVSEILADWLSEHGYGGLCKDAPECGCSLEDLCPCEGAGGWGSVVSCVAGYRRRASEEECAALGYEPGTIITALEPDAEEAK